MSLLDARCNLLNFRQTQGQSVNNFKEILKGWADAICFHSGSIAERTSAVPNLDPDGVERTEVQREEIASEETLAMRMIRGADLTKYRTLVADLANQFVKGKDEYPKIMASAATMLELYESPFNQPVWAWPPRNPGASVCAAISAEASAMTFMHAAGGRATYEQRVTASIAGTDGVLHPGISCYGCHGYVHYSDECPKATTNNTTGTTLMQYGLMLAQATENGIDPNWILLDSQSTISVFCNPNMLAKIRCSDRTLRALTNGGHQDFHMIGDFPNLGEVWFNKISIANILSLAEVRKVCRVTMDTNSEPAMHVHRLDGSIMVFKEHESGLYVHNPNFTNDCVNAYSMLSTVAAKNACSHRERSKLQTQQGSYTGK